MSLRLLDEARIAYAKCLVMQSTREISHGGEWTCHGGIGVFSDATSRYAAEVRELIKQHEGMPIEYTRFSVERADPVFEELAQRKTEMFKVEAKYLQSVLKKNLDVVEGLLPKDGWRDYSIDTPDRARIKILM